MPSDESSRKPDVRDAFLRVYRADLGTCGPRPLAEYLALFPGNEAAVADEYRVLEPPTDDDPDHQAARGLSDPSRESIGPYRVLRELGRGGQAVVYLAEHCELHRRVALKVLRAGLDGSGKRLARFRREAEIAARLDHPDICCVFEAGEAWGLEWIAMRYVTGETLAQKIADSRGRSEPSTRVVSLPERSGSSGSAVAVGSPASVSAPSVSPGRGDLLRVVALIERVARALHAAHEQGLIHRDVKPGNIMVTEDGGPVLLDFGMARDEDSQELSLTQSGDLVGTPYYMSPEQLLAKRVPLDRRTDVYSLGATLYECVTMRRAFEATSRAELYQRIIAQEAPDPRRINKDIPFELQVVIQTAIDRDRGRRYRTALDFAEDLRRVRTHEPIRARPIGPLLRSRRWVQRHPAFTGVLAVVTVALGITVWLLLEVSGGLARSRALNLVAAAKDELSRDPTLALLLAREAVRLDPSHVSLFHQVLTERFPVAEVRHPAHPELVWTWCGFSRNGERLLAIHGGNRPHGRAAVWDASGTLIATIEPAGGVLRAVDNQFGFISADGRRVALREADGAIRIWRIDGGNAVQEAELADAGGTDPIAGFHFHAGSDRLLVTRQSGAAALHDWQGRVWTLRAAGPGITSNPCFAELDGRVAFGCADGHVEVRSSEGDLLRRLASGSEAVCGLVATSSLDHLAARLAGGSLVLWHEAGERVVPLPAPEPREYADLAISPAGDRVLGFSSTGGDLWTGDGEHLAAIDGFQSIRETRDYWSAHAFAPDGEHFVTLFEGSSRIRIFDRNGKLLHVVRGTPWRPNSVRWLDGGRFLCSLRGEVGMFDLEGMELAAFRCSSGFEHLALATNGHRFATLVDDGRLLIWDTEREDLPTWTPGGVVMGLSILADGSRVAMASEKEGVALWTAGRKALERLGGEGLPVSGVAFSPDGEQLAFSRHTHIQVYDIASRQRIFFRGFDARWRNFRGLSYAPDGDELLLSQATGPPLAWRLTDSQGPSVTYADADAGLGIAVTAAITRRGDRVLTTHRGGGGESKLACWTRSGEVLWTRTVSGARWPRDATFSPDGSLLLASFDGGLELRDRNGQVLRRFVHPTDATVVRFSPDGTRFVTVGQDRAVRIWRLDFELVATLTGHADVVTDARFTRDGKRVLTSSRDGSVRTWYADVEELRERAFARPIRDLTAAERAKYAELLDH